MARAFNGSTDRIDFANVFTTSGQALTVAMWLFPNDLARVTQQYMFNGSVAGAAGTVFDVMDTSQNAGGLRFVRITDATSKSRGSVTGTLTASAWQHVLVTDDGSLTAANCRLYRDGVEVTYGETVNGTGTESTASGVWNLGGRLSDDARNLNGRMAEKGVWNRVLTADEITALGKGYCPLFLPNGLRFYAPLFGNGSNEPNYLGATATTLDGTSKVDHPNKQLIYPQRPQFVFEDAPAAGHPAIRRLGGARFARDIPVGVGGVKTF